MIIKMNNQSMFVLTGAVAIGILIGGLLERNRTNKKLASALARLANEGGRQ